jgi:hypothetical protein
MNPTIPILSLLVGIGLGAGVSYIFTKNSCEKRSQASINEMREYYKKKYESKEEKPKTEPETPATPFSITPEIYNKPDTMKTQYNNAMKDYASTNAYKEPDNIGKKPYIVSEEEYEEGRGFASMTLGWYRTVQKCITRSGEKQGEVWDKKDVEKLIGMDNIRKLEESTDGFVYVRNEETKTDYGIFAYAGTPDPKNHNFAEMDEDEESEVI